MKLAASVLLLVGFSTTPGCAASQAVKDEFDRSTASKSWFVCKRDENSFSFGPVADTDRTAATAVVRPLPKIGMLTSSRHHKGCARQDGSYDPDEMERAELWEADDLRLPLGTDIWYRFDMYIDDSIRPDTGRFVIGQWKQSNSPKDAPILAQRFDGHMFTVTIEQDNLAPHRAPDDVLCRVFIASQVADPAPGDSFPHTEFIAPQAFSELTAGKLSGGHDLDDAKAKPLSKMVPKGCSTGVRVTKYNSLPSPFGHWTTIVYHLRLVSNNTGLIEIWANGRKISKTEGVIGFFPFKADGQQYFKFGSYRNPAPFATTTRLDHYIRSESRSQVDPDGTLTP